MRASTRSARRLPCVGSFFAPNARAVTVRLPRYSTCLRQPRGERAQRQIVGIERRGPSCRTSSPHPRRRARAALAGRTSRCQPVCADRCSPAGFSSSRCSDSLPLMFSVCSCSIQAPWAKAPVERICIVRSDALASTCDRVGTGGAAERNLSSLSVRFPYATFRALHSHFRGAPVACVEVDVGIEAADVEAGMPQPAALHGGVDDRIRQAFPEPCLSRSDGRRCPW